MMENSGNSTAYCHPQLGQCVHFPVKGGDWWFSYGWRENCQMSLTDRLCPDNRLRNDILNGDNGLHKMNIIYVFYYNADTSYLKIYKNRRRALRNALESNNCPYSAIDELGLYPNVKWNADGEDTCSNNSTG